MELLTHGSLERKRHGLLGFHPNHAHYIKKHMMQEIGPKKCDTSCVRLSGGRFHKKVYYSLKVFQVFVVICDSI